MLLRKSSREIELRARASERKIIETFYLGELAKQRKQFVEELEKAKVSVINEMSASHNSKIKTLRTTIDNLTNQLSCSIKLWSDLKEFIPKASTIALGLKTAAHNQMDESSRKYGRVQGLEDELELLSVSLTKLAPKVDKLLNGGKEDG